MLKNLITLFVVVFMALIGFVLVTLNQQQKVGLDLGLIELSAQSVWVWVLAGVVFGALVVGLMGLPLLLQLQRLKLIIKRRDDELQKLRTNVLK